MMSDTITQKSRLSTWQAAFVIARRDFSAILFSKAFVLFLLGPLFFLGISAGAGMLSLAAAESKADPKLAVAMSEGDNVRFAEAHAALAELVRLPDIEVIAADTAATADDLLSDDANNFGAVLIGSLAEPELSGTEDRIESWQGEVAVIAANAAAAAGGEPAAFPEIALAPTSTSMAMTRTANSATATASLTLLFLLTMLLAGMVLSNLVEEKANKIIEILAAAIPMDAVFLGKLFAMLGISFVGIAVWGSIGGAIVWLGAEALPDIPAPAVGWPLFVALFLIYFAMAYLLIGSVFLAVGSMAPTVRDVQTISMPATMLQLGVFFLATYAMTDIGSPVEIFAVIFPLSSPYAMLARAAQDPTVWTHIAALAWQGLAVTVFIKTGATLFRKKVMKSGPPGGKKKDFLRGLFSKADTSSARG
ncbi:ABC transporter permease [Pontixanthobacter sp.]|uniref:ABC transporter permease n=1 Tax=Pontixanthobacter sp. TaxID=2792078 RepID=UPI003C79EED9